jgi:hypothetical protein
MGYRMESGHALALYAVARNNIALDVGTKLAHGVISSDVFKAVGIMAELPTRWQV